MSDKPCQRCGRGPSGYEWHHMPPYEPACSNCLDHQYEPAPTPPADPLSGIPTEHREALADHADAAFAYTSYLAGENEPAEAKRLRDTHQMAALNLYALNAHVHLPAVAAALRGGAER